MLHRKILLYVFFAAGQLKNAERTSTLALLQRPAKPTFKFDIELYLLVIIIIIIIFSSERFGASLLRGL